MYIYIWICEILVQPLEDGKPRGEQLPPFQLPLPHTPLHLFLYDKQDPTHLKQHILGCEKVLHPPMQRHALQPGPQGLREPDIYKCDELRTIRK